VDAAKIADKTAAEPAMKVQRIIFPSYQVYAFSAANPKSNPDQVRGKLSPENAMRSMEGLLAIYAFEYNCVAAGLSQLQPGTEVVLKRTQRTRASLPASCADLSPASARSRASSTHFAGEVELAARTYDQATPVRGHQCCGFSGSLGSGAFGRDERNYS
jgi:hypothetical protein